jgi:putative flippase GtrA
VTGRLSVQSRLHRVDRGRLVRFALVGGVGTVAYYVALWVMVEKLNVGVLTATSIAFALVVTENYVLHYHWTYVSSEDHLAALPKFIGMSVAGFFINWAMMFVGVAQLSLNYLAVQAVAIAVVVAWNYVLSRWWIFDRATKPV